MPILEKLQKIREESDTLDWTPDRSYPKGKIAVGFVSIQKLKRQLYPLFTKHRVDLAVSMSNPASVTIMPDGGAVRVRFRFDFTLTDVDDGTAQTSVVFGEGSTEDAKCEKTALSYATSVFLTSKFGICRGDDDEDEDIRTVLTNIAVPESHGNGLRTNDGTKKVQTVPVPPSPAGAAVGLSAVENKVREKAMAIIKELYEKGEVVQDLYEKASDLYRNADTPDAIQALLQIKRECEEARSKGGEF